MCIHVQSITYMHPDKDVLFSNVSFTISKGKNNSRRSRYARCRDDSAVRAVPYHDYSIRKIRESPWCHQ